MYYLLYADDYEISSKLGIDPEQPSLGRILADSIPPPQSPTSIKRCISRVEKIPSLVNADLYADTSSDTPLEDGHISILHTNGLGVSPNEPMAIVLAGKFENPITDGKYAIKNRAKNIFWSAGHNPIQSVYFFPNTIDYAKINIYMQVNNHFSIIMCSNDNSFLKWNITQDADGNISMTSPYAPSSWAGVEIKGSKVPVPWRLIPADGNFY